jgi:hypothetical protein|tara:strand:- start:3543 stop:4232 length:690 start_codon:yes stop_codon:yes gene_type:complete
MQLMNNYTWSYSSLSTFKQCPRKFYRTKIAKDVVEEDKDFLIYGREVHKAAEEYGRDGTPLPEKYEFIKPFVDTLINTGGNKHYELKMALTADLEPCDFKDPAAWWRGIADFVAITSKNALLVDYKTGKSTRYADTKQLEILSLAIFRHFPQVNTVKGGLMFLVAEELIEARYYKEKEETYWQSWDEDIERLNECFTANVWNPQSNFSCYKFCPVHDCEHNGRRKWYAT